MTSTMAANRPNCGSAPWYVVAFLIVLYIFSLVDRTIFSLLAAPISKDLGLTDAQMGVILGLGFAVVYAVAGLPIAHWLDTRPRKVAITTGVCLWSAMTIAAAFATDFWLLLVLRSGLAFGEAVLTPAAISLIGDLFGRERRALPTSIYASIGAIFSTGALALGAGALALATPIAHWVGLKPWQMTLMTLGIPTMLLSLLFLATVEEPPRIAAASGEASASLSAFFRFLRANARFYGSLYIGTGLSTCSAFGLYAWAPTIFQREHGLNSTTSGFVFGAVGIVGGLFGSLVIPQISARIERRRPTCGIPAGLLTVIALQIPVSIFLPAAGSPIFLYLCGFMTVLCSTSGHVLGSLSFQYYANSHMRARLMAIYLLATGFIGLAVGPSLTVFFSHLWPPHDRPLGHGLAMLGLCTTPFAGAFYVLAYSGARRLKVVTE
jgi:MFS family permease